MFTSFVRNYPYIHLGLGLVGNMLFFVGSILFLDRFSAWHHAAILMFIVGSSGMLLGAIGKAVTELEAARRDRGSAYRGGAGASYNHAPGERSP